MTNARKSDELLERVRRELAGARSTALLAAAPRQDERELVLRGTLRGAALGVLAAAGIGGLAVAAILGRGEQGDARDRTSPPAPAPVAVVQCAPVETNSPSAARPPARRAFDHFTVDVVSTGKSVEVALKGPANEPDEESYRALRHELRSSTGAESPIDPRLVEVLHQIAKHAKGSVQVLGAFRGPRSSELDYHARGMAADIRVADMTGEALRDLARSVGATGVGYYPASQFVHVDVREQPSYWTEAPGAVATDPAQSEAQEPTKSASLQ